MIIGEHYNKSLYNCAHAVASYYERELNITIPVVNEFESSFMRWMAKHFTKIDRPEEHCLVYMTNSDNTTHIGVYANYGVYHNYRYGQGYGAVIHSELSYILSSHKRVSYYKWSK